MPHPFPLQGVLNWQNVNNGQRIKSPHVLDEIKAEPSSVVFVDDWFENVLAAYSLGINGIVFDKFLKCCHFPRNLVNYVHYTRT